MAILSYGPYYESKIQSREKTKKALTGQGYTPEELAGATYGELMARYKDAEVRRQQETDVALREQQLGLQERLGEGGLAIQRQQLRGQEKAAKSAERGQIVSGIATGINVLDKVGALGWGKKAITGLVSPSVGTVSAPTSYISAPPVEDIWTGGDYGIDYGGGYEVAEGAGAMAGIGDYDYSWVGGGYDTGYEEVFIESVGAGTVICTELYRQGLLDEKTYLADSAYGALLDDAVLIGYHSWAEGIADKMRDSKILTKIVSVLAIPWAKEMAFEIGVLDKGHWLGKAMNIVGIPICRFIGRLMIGGAICPRIG